VRWAEEEEERREDDDPSNQVFADPGEFLRSFLRDESITQEERQLAQSMLGDWSKVPKDTQKSLQNLVAEINNEAAPLRRVRVPKKDSFWNEDNADTDLITDENGEDDFEEDDMLAMGHAKLEEHREFREYARIAVWEMPLLSSKRPPKSPGLGGGPSRLTGEQNLPSHFSRLLGTKSCASDTRPTWANSTLQTGRLWSSSRPTTWPT
jgi:small subunit ribosomal protein S35